MLTNRITSFFNNRTISFKIAIGFIFILTLFIYLSFFIIGKIGNLDRGVTDLSTLSKSTVLILGDQQGYFRAAKDVINI